MLNRVLRLLGLQVKLFKATPPPSEDRWHYEHAPDPQYFLSFDVYERAYWLSDEGRALSQTEMGRAGQLDDMPYWYWYEVAKRK